jgi:hypothetical protein
MWMRSKEWLEDPEGVQVPDSRTLLADARGSSCRYDSHTRLVLERRKVPRRQRTKIEHLTAGGHVRKATDSGGGLCAAAKTDVDAVI